MADMDDDELLAALGGFEDILRFHQTHGRAPRRGQDGDIFERLYAVRLDQLRKLPEAQTLLSELDTPGLLTAVSPINVDELDEDALLAELGIDLDAPAESADPDDITVLRHVRSSAAKRAVEEIGRYLRVSCPAGNRTIP